MHIRIICIIALLGIKSLVMKAQDKDISYYRCAFFDSYRNGDMSTWPKFIAEMEQANPKALSWDLEILKAMYGLVGYHIGLGDKEIAKTYISKAEAYFNRLLPENKTNAELLSMAGAFYGYKISLAFYKAPFLGPKSQDCIEKAMKSDPNEPMGFIEKGNSLCYMPTVLGGDKMEALSNYRKALYLFDAQKDYQCNWQKMLLRAFILRTLYETKQEKEAEIFLKSMERDYGTLNWIKKFIGAKYLNNK
jgi:hypothetical protein